MNDPRRTGAVVIVHQLLTPISDDDVEEALAPTTFGPGTHTVCLGGPTFQFDQLADLDWGSAHDALLRDVETKLLPVLDHTAGPIYYFGMLPIPLAIEMGRRLGPARRLLAHQQRHDSKSWCWPSVQETVEVQLTGAPDLVCHAKGDVIVRVTCSHFATAEDARQVVPYAVGELHVEVTSPHEDVLQSEGDVTRVASTFGRALDQVRRFFPNCETIHLFAAVPPALATRLGAEINPTIHKPIQTYQFSDQRIPRYTRALVVGERPRLEVTPAQRDAAAHARAAFARSLEQVRQLCEIPPSEHWLSDLVGPGAASLPEPLWKLGPLGRNKMILSAQVALDIHDADGEFRWDPATRAWIFDDRLLAALAVRLQTSQMEQAGRLFLLHESIHAERQGLTSATVDRVGRLPRVLEDADYLADVWALLHEYARAVRAGETDIVRAPEFFRHLLGLMTGTFWAFDAGDLPLRTIQVRRLNRYLIWYWQRLCLERADALAGVLRILATKPILEISGPRVSASRSRVLFDLDPVYGDGVEFGALVGGFRVVRIGSRPGANIVSLLEALRLGNERQFLDALRGIFDNVVQEEG